MNIILNGKPHEVAPGVSVAELLAELDLRANHVAVEVNLELVPRARHDECRLAPGDRLEVVTLVGGG